MKLYLTIILWFLGLLILAGLLLHHSIDIELLICVAWPLVLAPIICAYIMKEDL